MIFRDVSDGYNIIDSVFTAHAQGLFDWIIKTHIKQWFDINMFKQEYLFTSKGIPFGFLLKIY